MVNPHRDVETRELVPVYVLVVSTVDQTDPPLVFGTLDGAKDHAGRRYNAESEISGNVLTWKDVGTEREPVCEATAGPFTLRIHSGKV